MLWLLGLRLRAGAVFVLGRWLVFPLWVAGGFAVWLVLLWVSFFSLCRCVLYLPWWFLAYWGLFSGAAGCLFLFLWGPFALGHVSLSLSVQLGGTILSWDS